MNKTRRKITPIARKRRNFLYFFLAILFAIITVYIFLTFPPGYKFANLIPIVPIFLFSFFVFLYSILRFIFIYSFQAMIISSTLLGYLIIRLFGLTHWIFAALFLALFIALELFSAKKK